MLTNTPVALEADLDQDACDELIPILFVRMPATATPADAQGALRQVTAALVAFLGTAPPWRPALDDARGVIVLEPGCGRHDVAAGLALLESFARAHAAAAAHAA